MLAYQLRHATGSVELTLDSGRFVVKTQGTGLADKLRTIDVSVGELTHFCIVPTIGAQNMVARGVSDGSFDAELVFSYVSAGKPGKKRLFVNSRDPAFMQIISSLAASRPDASLLQLDPQEALRRIGVMSASKALWVILAVVIAIPVIITIIASIASR